MQNFRQKLPVFDLFDYRITGFGVFDIIQPGQILFKISVKFVVFTFFYFLFISAFFRISDIIDVITFLFGTLEYFIIIFRAFAFNKRFQPFKVIFVLFVYRYHRRR